MTPKGKKNLFIGLALTTIVGAAGYLIWSMNPKKPKGETPPPPPPSDDPPPVVTPPVVNTGSGTSSGGSSGGGYTPPTKSELATAYRAWANSTAELSKKYGKESKYDLDATGSANSFFDKSYAAGKTEYEAYLKDKAGVKAADLPANLKSLYNIETWGKTLGKNAQNQYYIQLKASTGLYYFFYDTGRAKIWNNNTKKEVSLLDWWDKGKSVKVTSGENKGKTFTANSPHEVMTKASVDPQKKESWTDATYTTAVVQLYDAMKGGGTKDNQFWSWYYKMTQTRADWDKFLSRWNNQGGYNFYTWVRDDIGSEYHNKLNQRMKNIGASTRW